MGSATGDDPDMYSEYDGVEPKWNDPSNYGTDESYYGNGKYPPDWDARREVILDQQNYWCGRCGRYAGDVDVFNVHHLRPLNDGGRNDLDNLVALCGDCHALMHPGHDDVEGNWERAPMFPDPDGDFRAAVIRRPVTDAEQVSVGHALAAIETACPNPSYNSKARSEVCYRIDSFTAYDVVDDIDAVLDEYDLALEDGCQGVYVRVTTPDWEETPEETTVTATFGDESVTKEVDGWGHASFSVPSSVETVELTVQSPAHDDQTVVCTFDDHQRRASEHVTLRKTPSGGSGLSAESISTLSWVLFGGIGALLGYGILNRENGFVALWAGFIAGSIIWWLLGLNDI